MNPLQDNHIELAGAEVTIYTDQPKAISANLFGIFFEDLNYAADGGLYAELIQNRSFAYSSADHSDWNFLTGWEIVQRDAKCSISLETIAPVHPNNSHYIVVNVEAPGGHIGLRNTGFDGIALKAGEYYNVSLFARTLSGEIGPLIVRLESRIGVVIGEATLTKLTGDWTQYTVTIQAYSDDKFARFLVMITGLGSLALDVISLFPDKTFCNRTNGLRADLAKMIADLKPKFVRFPGGCLAHGDGLDNMYRWKDTIGPIETRREQSNIWTYHQTVGLGYFEYFQFCEDIGAKPLPVVPAGVCCQNTGAKFNGLWGQGQLGLPMEDMPDYIQEVFDLIEWANGPATSTWGAKRAAAGHPEPFGLEYLGIGNEDRITPVFIERFKMIYEAVTARHPEILVIGTVGPWPAGYDYDEGWKVAHDLKIEMVDEHGYKEPDWFWENLQRFDAFDRTASAIYLGEYAAHDLGRISTLRSALAEAAYMTALERNGDIVHLASYAPLLAKQKHTQWLPDLIHFDNTTISPTINYYVQQLFSMNSGDTYLPTTVNFAGNEDVLTISTVRDATDGDIILKLVSRSDVSIRMQINVSGSDLIAGPAICTVLTGDLLAENSFGQPPIVLPKTSKIAVAEHFSYDIPAHSLSVIRVKTRT